MVRCGRILRQNKINRNGHSYYCRFAVQQSGHLTPLLHCIHGGLSKELMSADDFNV